MTNSNEPAADAVCECGHYMSEHKLEVGCCHVDEFRQYNPHFCKCVVYIASAAPPAHDTLAPQLRERLAEAERELAEAKRVIEIMDEDTYKLHEQRDTARAEAADLRARLAALHPLADMAAGLLAEKGAVQKLSAIRGIVNAQIEFSGKRLMDDVRHLHYSQAMIAVLKLIDMNGIPELLTKDAALDKLSDVLSEVSKNITDQPDDTQLMDNIEPGLLPEEEIYEDCDKRILKIVGDYFSLSWNKREKIYGDVNLITALRESGCVKTTKNSQADNLGA